MMVGRRNQPGPAGGCKVKIFAGAAREMASGVNPEPRFVPAPPAGPGRQAGFTLIELLLATALIALIMAMAYGGFRAGVRATDSGAELIEETNRLRVVHGFVRKQLAHAAPLLIEQRDDENIRFVGERDRIRFVAPMPGYLSYGGPYVQEFRLDRGRRGVDLVFAFAMLNGYQPGDLEAEPPVTLLEDVGAMEFDYLGYTEDGQDVVWNEFWENPDLLPLSVSMRLGVRRDNGLFWPELMTPVIIDNPGAAGGGRNLNVDDIRDAVLGGRGVRRLQ